ncbi:hypothetical protein CsSME_00047170 [Camellia sinensis var. sinensis]
MDSVKVLKLTFFIAIIFVFNHPNVKCQLLRRPSQPLCISQLALANHACSLVPHTGVPPPSPPSPPSPSPSEENSPTHGHGHRHRHRHRESPIEHDCCRWLKEVDTACVCELLIRLPTFLSRPVHEYTVEVDETCSVTYACGGRLRA